jgi:hypothetical protein
VTAVTDFEGACGYVAAEFRLTKIAGEAANEPINRKRHLELATTIELAGNSNLVTAS